jgi:hypothetical protein
MTPSSRQNCPDAGWNFDNSCAQLPEAFYVRLNPVPVRAPKLIIQYNGSGRTPLCGRGMGERP